MILLQLLLLLACKSLTIIVNIITITMMFYWHVIFHCNHEHMQRRLKR